VIGVLATSDIHVPRFASAFLASMETVRQEGAPDLLLIAGDLVSKGDPSALGSFLDQLRGFYAGPIVSCQGNEEYEERLDDIRAASAGQIEWLLDEVKVYEVNGFKLAVYGSKGALERPTFWQRTHTPNAWKARMAQISLMRSRLERLRETDAQLRVVLTHYSPTRATMVGEREKMWPEMGYPGFEEDMKQGGFDLWIHGHVHRGQLESVQVGSIVVYNVAFPARKRPVWVVRKARRAKGWVFGPPGSDELQRAGGDVLERFLQRLPLLSA